MYHRKYVYYVVVGLVTIVAFVALMQITQRYSDSLQSLIQLSGIAGVVSYIALIVISVVFAPVSMAFLLPVAANGWGPFAAAVYSILGWTIGSMIAFFLARRYGLQWVAKFSAVKRMRAIEESIPTHHVFWFVVLLRITLPVDVLSYALGIFSSMNYWPFFWSTVIGISFFAFLFAYASVSSMAFQIFTVSLGLFMFLAVLYYIFFRKRSSVEPEKD